MDDIKENEEPKVTMPIIKKCKCPKIDWKAVLKSPNTYILLAMISIIVNPLLGHTYYSILSQQKTNLCLHYEIFRLGN